MPRTTGPLLSFSAQGSVGKTITYDKWRGIATARRWSQPAQPRTAPQLNTRTVISGLSQIWKMANTVLTDPWEAQALGKPTTARSAWIERNAKLCIASGETGTLQATPAASKVLPVTVSATTVLHQELRVTVTPSPTPAGWTFVHIAGWALWWSSFATITDWRTSTSIEATFPYTLEFTGLTTGTTYRMFCYARYITPAGNTYYTPTAVRGGVPT